MIDWNAPTVARLSQALPNPVDWDSAGWGQDGYNVHQSENGSDVPDRHGKDN